MPMDFGPVKFSIEGTFTEKPRLLMNGEEVAYDSLYVSHRPEFKYEDYDGKEIVEPASTDLSFSVSAKIGQLEANVMYRVKANDDNGIVLAACDEDHMDKSGKKSPKNEKKSEKPDFKKFKKGKSDFITISPDPRSPLGQKIWRENLAESIADAGQ